MYPSRRGSYRHTVLPPLLIYTASCHYPHLGPWPDSRSWVAFLNLSCTYSCETIPFLTSLSQRQIRLFVIVNLKSLNFFSFVQVKSKVYCTWPATIPSSGLLKQASFPIPTPTLQLSILVILSCWAFPYPHFHASVPSVWKSSTPMSPRNTPMHQVIPLHSPCSQKAACTFMT